MNKIKNIAILVVENNYNRHLIFKILVSILIVLSFVYIYFIISITFNIVARKSLENNAKILTNEINDLELTYLSKLNTINKEYAYNLGFVDVNNNVIIASSSNSVAIR